MSWLPLVEYRREGLTEVVVHGAIAWAQAGRTGTLGGDALLYGRSLLKPFQMKAIARDLDPVLTPDQKALSVASHDGTERHVALARSMLNVPLTQKLQVPPSRALGGGGGSPDRWQHPCSGKHAAILRACELRGWSTADYVSAEHPYHEALLAELRRHLGEDWTPQVTAVDGCGLPTPSLSLTELARLFASLGSDRDTDWIWNAMTAAPELVGGPGRLDTTLLQAGAGNVLAKEGADGLLGVAFDDVGLVVKIAHGSNPAAAWYVAEKLLLPFGIEVPPRPEPARQTVHVSADVELAHRDLRG